MMKLLGSGLIFLGGALFHRIEREEVRREMDTLWNLAGALTEAAEEIRTDRMALPRVLERASRDRTPPVAAFLRKTADAARRGQSVQAVWNAEAETLALGREDLAVMERAGRALSGDEDQVTRGLLQGAEALLRSLEERRSRRPDRERRAAALSFSGAALLVILLI